MTAQPKKIEADARMKIWNALSKTDPAQTKSFSRAGGFKGTAVKPMWVVKRLTEEFGPCGVGWGMDEPQFQVVNGDNREVLVFCTVSGWFIEGDKRATVYGVGGDKVVTYIKANAQYNRPERWENDDEAFKKAFTDAVNNAFKFVGVAADIHMGLFDDSKYVAEVAQEFEAVQAGGRLPGISKIKARLNKLMLDGDKATDLEAFNALVHDCKDELTKVRDANHQYWTGDGEDFEGFKNWIVRRREELTPVEGSVALQFLLSLLAECQRQSEVQNIAAKHGEAIDALEDAERRLFEQKFDEREAALAQLDRVTEGA